MNTFNKIILLSGFASSGKDVFADYLVAIFGYTKISIANQLKLHTAMKYEFCHDLTLTQMGKQTFLQEHKKSVRDLLIMEAQEQKTIYGDHIWVKESFKNLHNINNNLVVSDVRFPYEISYIQQIFPDKNVSVVRITNNRVTSLDTMSEHQLDNYPFDKIVANNGSLSELYQQINSIHLNIPLVICMIPENPN